MPLLPFRRLWLRGKERGPSIMGIWVEVEVEVRYSSDAKADDLTRAEASPPRWRMARAASTLTFSSTIARIRSIPRRNVGMFDRS